MDVNDSFSSFYPSYFNQSGSASSWSPSPAGHESKMGTSANGKFKSESEFDYHVLVESLFNKGAQEKLHASGAEQAEGAKRPGTPAGQFPRSINWSDFDDKYLSKSVTRQLARTSLKEPDLLTQLQSDWQPKNGAAAPAQAAAKAPGLGVPPSVASNLNSVFSRILEEGYETRLNSSRSSVKSTNRTSLPGGVAGVGKGVGSLGGLAYGGGNALLSNLISNQLLNANLGAQQLSPGLGALGPSGLAPGGLGNNINAQLLRSHLLNNQLLNRQILGGQLLNSQVLAGQGVFPGPSLAGAFRNLAYGGELLAGGQFGAGADFVPGEFVGAEYLQGGFGVDAGAFPPTLYDCHGYAYGKFGKQLLKSPLNFKGFKGRPLRKKRGKADMFPLPSLKEAEFERAVEYLKETLVSLYRDQIMPIYFNVRGRFIEFNSDEIAPEHIMDICKRKPEVFNVVSNGALNETFIYLVEEPAWFSQWVDRNDLTDIYERDMWVRFFEFIKAYKDEEGNDFFPGSIYGMSRVMQRLELPFLRNMSLGTICHIVQLAIRLKKYLVYDLKTLKPSDAVKNGPFFDAPPAAEAPEAVQRPAQSGRLLEGAQALFADPKVEGLLDGGLLR